MKITFDMPDDFVDKVAKKVAILNKKIKPYVPKQKREVIIPNNNELQYTVGEVAEMSKQSEQTIARHCRDGLLIAAKVGKSWKITQNNYLKYINNEN